MSAVVVRAVKVTFGPDVTVSLPEGATPLNFINQGKQGVFLWYSEFPPTPPTVEVEHKFHFVGKDAVADSLWSQFGTQVLKKGKYFQAFKE